MSQDNTKAINLREMQSEAVSIPFFSVKASSNYIEASDKFVSSCFPVVRPRDNKVIFITTLHSINALSDGQRQALVVGSGQRRVTRILKTNQMLDIAAFEIESTEGVVPFSLGTVAEQEPVVVDSYGYLNYLKATKHLLLKGYMLFFEGGRSYFAVNIFYPGGSGAPVLNGKAEVCAMAAQRLTIGTDEIYTGVINAIPSDMLRQFIASL
jgi:hypothetical protein